MELQEARFRAAVKARTTYTGPVFVQECDYPMCAACGGLVDSLQGATVGAYSYHTRCLRCVDCRKTFSLAKDVNLVDGKLHCVQCLPPHMLKRVNGPGTGRMPTARGKSPVGRGVHTHPPRAIAERCYRCRQPFTANKEVIDGLGMRWHTRCFSCIVCMTPIDNESEAVLHDSLPVHIRCTDAVLAKQTHLRIPGSEPLRIEQPTMECHTCGQRLEGGVEYRQVLGRYYHVNCARCKTCGGVISSACQVQGKDLICANCALK